MLLTIQPVLWGHVDHDNIYISVSICYHPASVVMSCWPWWDLHLCICMLLTIQPALWCHVDHDNIYISISVCYLPFSQCCEGMLTMVTSTYLYLYATYHPSSDVGSCWSWRHLNICTCMLLTIQPALWGHVDHDNIYISVSVCVEVCPAPSIILPVHILIQSSYFILNEGSTFSILKMLCFILRLLHYHSW